MAKRKLNVEIGNYDPRGSKLSNNFMKKMKSYPFLIEYANNEANGLDVQLRGDSINIYYQGGSLIRLSGTQSCKFDENYFYLPKKGDLRMTDIKRLCHPNFRIKKEESKALKNLEDKVLMVIRQQANKIQNDIIRKRDALVHRLKECDSLESVGVVVEEMKKTMDDWKTRLVHNGIRKEVVGERTVQHYISLHNKKFGEKTDFVVLDIEYAISTNASYAKEFEREKQPRIDILAIEKDTGQIYTMELKYGMKSVGGEASAKKHYDDYLMTVGKDSKWRSFLNDVNILLKAKQDYGIISKDLTIKDSKPVFAFVMKKEIESDEESFRNHLKETELSHIPTLYLPVEKDYETPSIDGHKLSKDFIK